ncbi:hypothetical protein HMI01_08520 [Halolactibacillus miurensis]|uniref:Predicted dehydrogenase n=1 Tax=Halolactibacillus miurensis TaxID=306541 RepID=A0A1I6RFG3_9BACI|nr:MULTISPECIES: Gfo/Idh/MocA family oxidoreductase [Halolactibacillus]GEM03864.1 hypothetical protein HMI01_08520 [Halolactibacillus miurensis]SFS63469.1 Predicted dehydrogenase [Halolactibacillus miurensis]
MTIKIGMVGTGGFSQKHADILMKMDQVRLVAVCGTSEEKAKRFAEQYDGMRGYSDFHAMLDAEKLDGVYLCVPPMAHGEMELTLVKHRIPFFVEKPLGVTTAAPEKVVEALEKAPLVTAVGYHFRYLESIQYLKRLLKDHTVGLVTGRWMGSMPEVSWWRNQALSGGQLNEQATHIVDLLRYLLGESEEVHAYEAQRVMNKRKEDVTVADVGTLSIRFKSGVIANITNTCILPEGLDEIGFTMYTDSAVIEWTPESLTIKTGKTEKVMVDTQDPYYQEDEAFIQSIKSGSNEHILSTYQNAYNTQLMTDAARVSVEKHSPINLND